MEKRSLPLLEIRELAQVQIKAAAIAVLATAVMMDHSVAVSNLIIRQS